MPAQISHRKLIAEDLARKISGTFATSAAHRSVIESALFDETVMDATKILADTLIPASSVDQILKMESTASLVVTSAVELGSAPKSELRENFNLTITEIMGNVLNKDSTEVPKIDQFFTTMLQAQGNTIAVAIQVLTVPLQTMLSDLGCWWWAWRGTGGDDGETLGGGCVDATVCCVPHGGGECARARVRTERQVSTRTCSYMVVREYYGPCLPAAVTPQAPQAEVALAATEASGRSSHRPPPPAE